MSKGPEQNKTEPPLSAETVNKPDSVSWQTKVALAAGVAVPLGLLAFADPAAAEFGDSDNSDFGDSETGYEHDDSGSGFESFDTGSGFDNTGNAQIAAVQSATTEPKAEEPPSKDVGYRVIAGEQLTNTDTELTNTEPSDLTQPDEPGSDSFEAIEDFAAFRDLGPAGVYPVNGRFVVRGTPDDDSIVVEGRRFDFIPWLSNFGDYRVKINGETHYIDNPENLVINGVSGNDTIVGGPGDDTIITGPGENHITDTRGDNLHFGANQHNAGRTHSDAKGLHQGAFDTIKLPFNQVQAYMMKRVGVSEGFVATPNTIAYQKMLEAAEGLDMIGEPDSAATARQALQTQNVGVFNSSSDDEGLQGSALPDSIFVRESTSLITYAHEAHHAAGVWSDGRVSDEHNELRASAVGHLAAFAIDHNINSLAHLMAETERNVAGSKSFSSTKTPRLKHEVRAAFGTSLAKMPPGLWAKLKIR